MLLTAINYGVLLHPNEAAVVNAKVAILRERLAEWRKP